MIWSCVFSNLYSEGMWVIKGREIFSYYMYFDYKQLDDIITYPDRL